VLEINVLGLSEKIETHGLTITIDLLFILTCNDEYDDYTFF